MIESLQKHKAFWIILIGITLFYTLTLSKIPFHPDESTQIYMSNDFFLLTSNPGEMSWKPGEEISPQTKLRQLDAPLTRYIIGLGRFLGGQKGLENNWSWSSSWEENRQAGALPSRKLLTLSRLSISLLLPLSLTFFYFSLSYFIDKNTALMGTLLFGLHPLILLHARRAMAEGALILGITLFLWGIRYRLKKPWLIGLAAGLASNAKQSAIILLPLGLFAVGWFPKDKFSWKSFAKNIGLYLGTFLFLTFLLNPLLWDQPLLSYLTSWQTRLDFTTGQIASVSRFGPNQLLENIPIRLVSLVINLFVNEPSIADVGNYSDALQATTTDYLNFPLFTLGRGLIWGSLFFALAVGGLFWELRNLPERTIREKQDIFLVLLATFFQAAALLLFVPLPWQRYTMPLLPFVSFWIALGLQPITDLFSRLIFPVLGSDE